MPLPAAISRLLATKRPNPLPSPALARLTALFDATRAEALAHGAPNGWLVLSVSRLVSDSHAVQEL